MLAYLDCFSGISGDMLLGALLHAGLDLDELRAGLATLPLSGYTLEAERVSRSWPERRALRRAVSRSQIRTSTATCARFVSILDRRTPPRTGARAGAGDLCAAGGGRGRDSWRLAGGGRLPRGRRGGLHRGYRRDGAWLRAAGHRGGLLLGVAADLRGACARRMARCRSLLLRRWSCSRLPASFGRMCRARASW